MLREQRLSAHSSGAGSDCHRRHCILVYALARLFKTTMSMFIRLAEPVQLSVATMHAASPYPLLLGITTVRRRMQQSPAQPRMLTLSRLTILLLGTPERSGSSRTTMQCLQNYCNDHFEKETKCPLEVKWATRKMALAT